MSDWVLRSDIIMEGDRIIHKITQPTENLILERNSELRKNEGCIQDLGAQSGSTWGRMVACIPENLLIWANRNGYDLNNKDPDFASKELFRFLNSEKGKPCLVRNKL